MKPTILLLAAAVALAQAPQAQQAPQQNVSISGIVKDSATGQPLANYNVATSVNVTYLGNTVIQGAGNRTVQSTTDESGRYRLADLPPGDYRVAARAGSGGFGNTVTRHIALAARDMEGVDFQIVVPGAISGRVIDENKEPVPGLTVMLVSREYYLGNLGYFPRNTAQTDDRGQYRITNVIAGRPFLLMVEKRDRSVPTHSEVPLDPKLRRRVPMRTWYPNSPVREGAGAVVLRPGEHRERVDIDVRKSQSYCADGILEGPNGPAALRFGYEALTPSSGTSSSGGMYMAAPGSMTAADGKFRICNLYPGSFRLSVNDGESPFFAAGVLTITDRDLHNVRVAASPGLPLEGEVVYDGEAPLEPVTTKVSILMSPLLRTQNRNENNSVRADIPSTFRLESLLLDGYSIRTTLNSPTLYVKDVQYGGRSVMNEPFQFGGAMPGAGLRVVVGRDGAKLSARVADKDGNPVPDMHIIVMPGEFRSDGALAATVINGRTNQHGSYTSQLLAPGKYYIAATDSATDPTPESVSKLWRSRDRFKEVELTPKGTAQVTLEPVRLD